MEDHLKRLYVLVDELKVESHWRVYVDAFVFGCKIRNLAPRTLNVYAERLGYLVRHLEGKGIDIEDLTKQEIHTSHPFSLEGSRHGRLNNHVEGIYQRANSFDCDDRSDRNESSQNTILDHVLAFFVPDDSHQHLYLLNLSDYRSDWVHIPTPTVEPVSKTAPMFCLSYYFKNYAKLAEYSARQ